MMEISLTDIKRNKMIRREILILLNKTKAGVMLDIDDKVISDVEQLP